MKNDNHKLDPGCFSELPGVPWVYYVFTRPTCGPPGVTGDHLMSLGYTGVVGGHLRSLEVPWVYPEIYWGPSTWVPGVAGVSRDPWGL